MWTGRENRRHMPWRFSTRLEAAGEDGMGAVLAGAVDQRLAVPVGGPVHAADEDDVVAADDLVLCRALEAGEGVGQERAAAETGHVADVRELVRSGGREMPRQV